MSYPKITLSNGDLQADVFLPDAAEGFYQGPRFDWSGMMDQIRWEGHTFLCSSDITQDKDFRACGTAEELCMGILGTPGPLGYDQAEIGEGFIKPGVGILEKHTDDAYQFEQPHKIIQPGSWDVRHGEDWIEFRQEIDDVKGWGYRYTKRVSVSGDKPEVVIARELENVGSREIDTTHYCHNFMLFDDEPVGPDYIIRLPFAPKIGDEEFFGRVATDDNDIVFSQAIPVGDFAWGVFTGFDEAADYAFELANTKTQTAVRISGNSPLLRFHLYCQQAMICPEPFVRLLAKPGEKTQWQTTYALKHL